MAGPFSLIFALLLLFGGSRDRGDMLDLLATESYWQIQRVTVGAEQLQRDMGPDEPVANADRFIKDLQSDDFATRSVARRSLEQMGPAVMPQLRPAAESKDPEVASVAAELLKKFSEHGQARAIRRLMAIRTLGERKEVAAISQLKALTDSKEMFVADYARRAIAQIDGTAYESPDRTKEFQQDVALFPRDSSLIFHAARLGQKPITLASLVDALADALKQLGNPLPMAPGDKPFDKKDFLLKNTERLLAVIERVGNVRLDGVTVAFTISQVNGQESGWAIATVRGKYDSKLMFDTVRELGPFRDSKINAVSKPGDIAMIAERDGNMTILFPSDDRMIFITAPTAKDGQAARDAMIAALKNNKGTFAENLELGAMLKTIDMREGVWAVGRMTEEMKKEKIFEGISTFTLQGKSTREGVDFVFKGQGEDAEKVKGSVDEINRDIQAVLPAMREEAKDKAMLQPVVDFFASMKATADGKNAQFVGQFKPTIMEAVIAEFGPYLVMLLDELEPREPLAPPKPAR